MFSSGHESECLLSLVCGEDVGGQGLDDVVLDTFLEQLGDLFPLVEVSYSRVHDGIEEDAMDGDVVKQFGHAERGVLCQIDFADLEESTVTSQAAQRCLEHFVRERVQHDVDTTTLKYDLFFVRLNSQIFAYFGVLANVKFEVGASRVGEVMFFELRELLLQIFSLVLVADSREHFASIR